MTVQQVPIRTQIWRKKPIAAYKETSGDGLKRSLGTFTLMMFGVGSTVGTGVFFVMHEAVPDAGPAVIIKDLFGNKAEKAETPGWLYPILSLVFLFVGLIEVFSIAIRPFTLSVRLFGNVFGGENLLHGTSFFPVFYFMELLVGLIQALVFTLLTSVYIGLLCNHGDDHDHAPAGGHAAEAHH